jgi:S-disulfanyl-L-cysteine oxidoreductase SoxD
MSSCFKRFVAASCACALVGVSSPVVHGQASRTAKDGVYSDEQARRGQAVYKDRCATCHGATLGGDLAPPLAGNDFTAVWAGPLSDIVNKIQNTMPATEPGTLTRQQSSDIVAYMLQMGKFPAGRAELSADEAVQKQIALAASQPTQARPQTPAISAQAPVFPAAGNLNQVMRGILFPSSNLIFNVQTHDPGAPAPKRPANQSTDAAFSMVDWGAGIYKGWEIVDYAAVALAEVAPLMLTPGRRCENGRPVPVQDADWVKYTIELADAGRAAYKASQTRKQDVVSDVTEQIANACLHCHQVYRDKRGGRNAADLSNQAARCVK